MKDKNLKVLGVAETRWKGSGWQTLHNDYNIIYSGKENSTDHGVGIILAPKLAACIQNTIYKIERIIATTLKI